jgi:deoxyribose-phosphate aldolase
MTNEEIFRRVDHTLLKASASWDEIQQLCTEAIRYKTASICIPPYYVAPVHQTFGSQVPICTVIGFPLGYTVKTVKIRETKQAVTDGAAEIDMVINIASVKSGRLDLVKTEIADIKKACGGHILKVIIET